MSNLTDEELQKLKILLEMPSANLSRLVKIANEDEKWEWLWANLRKLAVSIATVVAALVLFKDNIANLWDWLMSFIFTREGR